jgi:hypothetical protein
LLIRLCSCWITWWLLPVFFWFRVGLTLSCTYIGNLSLAAVLSICPSLRTFLCDVTTTATIKTVSTCDQNICVMSYMIAVTWNFVYIGAIYSDNLYIGVAKFELKHMLAMWPKLLHLYHHGGGGESITSGGSSFYYGQDVVLFYWNFCGFW